ncbi:MAG: hypothetical protein IT580_05730, partial [Verrucomicrobiales bacterium]|nr:hypothetical protein [Verrucomicrobiales bacterium]
NQGLISISTNSTLYLAGASLTNEVEGRILQAGGQLRGNYRESFENRGEWSVPGAGALAVSGLIVRQAGRLTVDQGDFEFWGGTVEFLIGSTNRGTGRLLLSSNPARSGAPLRFDSGLVISSGVLTNEADQTWSNLSLQQGTIEGAGTLVVTQQWMAGNSSLLGTGSLRLPVGCTVLVPASRYLVLERSVESDADWLFDTNASILMGKSTFRSRGQIELRGGAHWRASSGVESGSLEIHGTLRKTGVDRSMISGVGIRNLGRLLIEAGSLQVASRVSNAGRIHVELGATLEWQASAEYDAASYLGGPGSVVFASGSHDLLGTFEPLGPWRVESGEVRVRRPMPPTTRVHTRSGRVTLDQPQTFASMDLAQGEWTFAHDVTLTESGSLSATRLRGPGRWIIATNASVSVASSSATLELECLNQGRLELAPDTLLRFGGARLVNWGELTLIGAATFLGTGGSTNDVLNHGLFRAGTNTLRFSSVGFSALGRQILQPAEISLDRGTNATDWIMPAGGRTVFNESFRHLPGSHLGGAGDVEFARGTQDVAGHMSVTGTLRFQGADVRFAEGFTNLAPTRLSSGSVLLAGTNLWRDLTFAGGRLAPQELLRLSRSLDWTAGTLEGAGRLRIEPTASAQARGYGGQALSSTLEVAGTFSITNDTRIAFREGALHVVPGGVHDLGAAVAYWNSGNASGALWNEGLIRKTGPGVVDLDLEIGGEGEWKLQGGRLDLGSATRLAGAWSIATDTELRLEGATNRIATGASWAGDGTIRVTRAGTLQLEADTDFGSLEVVLAASLQVSGEHALRSGIDGSLSLTGPSITVEGPVEVAGNLEIGAATTVRIDDELRLTTGATLTNRGRRDAQNRSNVRVRGFPSLGGTVSGIPPDVIPASSPLRLVPGGADRLTVLGLSHRSTDTPGRWHLNWWCAAGVATRIESSTDLAVWHELVEIPAAANAGWHAVPVEAADEETRFFRIRETEW